MDKYKNNPNYKSQSPTRTLMCLRKGKSKNLTEKPL